MAAKKEKKRNIFDKEYLNIAILSVLFFAAALMAIIVIALSK